MKFVVVVALIAAVASMAYGQETRKISGSYAGPFPRRRSFYSDYVTAPALGGEFTILSHRVLNEPLIGQTVTGHALLMSGVVDAYHIYAANGNKCPGKATTSATSEEHNCKLATNAGFFNIDDGSCIGPIVSDGEIIHTGTAQGAIFGITNDGRYVAGYANQTAIESGEFKQLVQGRGWLVRNGQSYVNTSVQIEGIEKYFVTLLAPRLAIGWDTEGRLILVIVDGIESKRLGLDLHTFTDLLIKLGCVEAINLDGGGSVTFVWDGHICESSGVGQEKCEGNPEEWEPSPYFKPYERPVTSVTCFKTN